MNEIPNLSNLSLSSVSLDMIFSETNTTLASGTGFFWRFQNSLYLITNWHNVTGKNPQTLESLANHGGIPDIIRFPLIKLHGFEIETSLCEVNLYFDSSRLTPAWFIHPHFKEKVDVIALEFNPPDGFNCIAINDIELGFKDFKPAVADDAFILGFPLLNKQMGLFPIWKKASIASEPEFDFDEMPIIIVDSASRPGMSGSPVILRRNGIWLEPKSGLGTRKCFLGIYSGRIIGKTNFEAQLGIVWKKHLIEEIIIGRTRNPSLL